MCSGRIVYLDAVKGLDILFHVYLLRMLDVVLNPLDHHRQNVALGIIGQPDQRHPVELNLVSQSQAGNFQLHQLRTKDLRDTVEIVFQ